MTRERIVYYVLIGALFASVFFLISWWNNIQTSVMELPKTGGSTCGIANASVSIDGISYSKEVDLAKNYARLYLKLTDNIDKSTPCAEIELALMSFKCEDINKLSTCIYDEKLDNWGPFTTDINGVARIDSEIFGKAPGQYKFQFKEADTLYAWSSPVDVVINENDGVVSKSTNLEEYIVYNEGDIFSYISKSYLSTNNRLIIPKIGTTRIEIEKDTYWGDNLVRPWRVLKDDPSLYWHPIPLGQGSDGTYRTDDEVVRYMFSSPKNQIQDKRLQAYNEYIWLLGHKSYHRFNDESGIKDINIKQFNSLGIYTNSNLSRPGLFLGKKTQSLPFTYFEDKSIYNFYSTDEKTSPSLFYPAGPNRSLMVRIEKENWPISANNVVYDDVVRVDIYEGSGDFTLGGIESRESWYFAKNIGLVKLETKYFSAGAIYGMGYDYPYFLSCNQDPDCLADSISTPHLSMDLNFKTKANELKVIPGSQNSITCNENKICYSTLNLLTDNGIYIKSDNPLFTGYLESKDEKGAISKSFYLESGEVFIPSAFFASDKGKTFELTFRQYIDIEKFPQEQRFGDNNNAWTSKILIDIR